jgi:uncharacterized Zn finger protein (UPF0148 family)
MDQIEQNHAFVKMIVLDGIVMGPTHCAYGNCTSDLINARGGAFCPFHETQYGARCRVHNCQNIKVNPTEACEQHQPEWRKHVQTHTRETHSGVRRILRSGETLPWHHNIQGNVQQPHDQEVDPNAYEHQRKNYFRIYFLIMRS